MSRVLPVPEPGQLVDVRHRRYVVVEVTPSTLPLPVLHSGTLVTHKRSTDNSEEALKRRFAFIEILPPTRAQREAEQARRAVLDC